MAQRLMATPTATRPLQRLTIQRPPPVRSAVNRPGVDPREKRRVALGLLNGHEGAVQAKVALHQLVGSPPAFSDAEASSDARRSRGKLALAPEAVMAQWGAARDAITI